MGGSGSGRPGWRRKAESCLRLDIRKLARDGVLRPGALTSWQWSNSDGEPCGAIQMRAGLEYPEAARATVGAAPWCPGLADHVRLIYARDGEPFDYAVWLERTPQHYGGHRLWWLCPRCGQRRAVLYGVASSDGRFGCIGRHPNRPEHRCMNLAYSTEAEDRTGRLWRKQRKLEARVNENRTGTRYVKPKGMHWRTFNALCDRIDGVEQEKDAAFFEGAAAMLARYGWPGDMP
jgi:hypothetical protein